MKRTLTGILLTFTLVLTVYCSYQASGGLSTLEPSSGDQGRSESQDYTLGQTTVSMVLYHAAKSPLLLFNMHDDENTAVEAALEILPELGGSLLHLEHSGERLIEFSLNDTVYRFDPNRIFTDAGARLSLERYGPFSMKAFEIVRTFARHLVEHYGLSERSVMITLHNNTEGTYSAESYLPGAEYARDAREVFLHPGADPDDFFFVTESRLFDRFKEKGFNVVLQDNQQVTDDGSLSVLAGRVGIPYVNVEAQHEHLEEQKRMLRVLYEVLASVESPHE